MTLSELLLGLGEDKPDVRETTQEAKPLQESMVIPLRLTLTHTLSGFVLDLKSPRDEAAWKFDDGLSVDTMIDRIPYVVRMFIERTSK